MPTAYAYGLCPRRLPTAYAHGVCPRRLPTAYAHGVCPRRLPTASAYVSQTGIKGKVPAFVARVASIGAPMHSTGRRTARLLERLRVLSADNGTSGILRARV
jgi:hypothetical protein